MVVWSTLCRGAAALGIRNVAKASPQKALQMIVQRNSSHGPRMMQITPSRFQWNKFKDALHFYTMLGLIPVTIVVVATNIFIGPATLEPIPEDYVPKHWEYYRHPITRFIARYMHHPPQQDYEKFLHFLYEENEKRMIRQMDKKIEGLMFKRQDYKGEFFRPAMIKYYRAYREAGEELENLWGDE